MEGFDLPVLPLEEAIKYGVLIIILSLVTLNEWLRCSFMSRRSIRENWMARIGLKCWGIGLVALIFLSSLWRTPTLVSASELRGQIFSILEADNEVEPSYFEDLLNFFWQDGRLGYHKVWPKMEFGWRIIVGAAIGFFGAAFGSVGGVGGGGIFVPMLTLIVGFDQKSSTAISKCMITGAAVSTVIYNLRLRNPSLDMPLIDYDLALLFQPMLVLGISIGVAFNVIFADWMITILLIIIFITTATKAMLKGIETWKKETLIKKEAARRLQEDEVEYKPLAGGPSNGASQPPPNEATTLVVPILSNIRWKELGVLTGVWLAVLALQIIKLYMTTCSVGYWIVNVLQFPATMGVSAYQSFCLYKGRRVIASKGAQANTNWKILHLVFYCFVGMLAGVVGGMLGLGGGFILGPLFLEMGIPPQVSSATATFAMIFSASMSVVEYYLLKRFPVPYALYFVAVATVSAVVGQLVVRKLVSILGRASLIIFILAFTIYISAVALGGVGLERMVKRIERHEYMGFDDLCTTS